MLSETGTNKIKLTQTCSLAAGFRTSVPAMQTSSGGDLRVIACFDGGLYSPEHLKVEENELVQSVGQPVEGTSRDWACVTQRKHGRPVTSWVRENTLRVRLHTPVTQRLASTRVMGVLRDPETSSFITVSSRTIPKLHVVKAGPMHH